jgi:hypothetical protein
MSWIKRVFEVFVETKMCLGLAVPMFERWGLRVLGISLVEMILESFNAPQAVAAIRTIEEAPGQMLYQSRHRLRDKKGNSWQVILFKRVNKDDSTNVNLRLVAFPGIADFAHPQPLKITTKNGDNFKAEDMFAKEAPATNVGEYDVKNILQKLPILVSINLSLLLKDNQVINIQIPPEVVLEWQTIAAKQ